MKNKIIKILKILGIVAAAYILLLIVGFFGVRLGLTNVAGSIDSNSEEFAKNDARLSDIENAEGSGEGQSIDEKLDNQLQMLTQIKKIKTENYCKINEIGKLYPKNAKKIILAYEKTDSDALIAKMILAVQLRLNSDIAFFNKMEWCEQEDLLEDFSLESLEQKFGGSSGEDIFPWIPRPEWQAIKEATIKDKDAIDRAAQAVGIEPRIIVASMVVEQLRLFNSEREIFKKFFEPLKILCNANKISLGVMGIKEATAINIENHLKDPSSPYYLGKEHENILDYPAGTDIGKARYDRLTDEKDHHYYSYLYGALYLRQMMEQWERAGYDIRYRMEILGTLFNVGFPQSKPKGDPKVGGSSIDVGIGKYSFGSLSYEFYYSGELLDEFPYVVIEK